MVERLAHIVKHIAIRDIRRLDILWAEEEVADYDRLKEAAKKVKQATPDYVKNVLRNYLKNR